MSSAPPAPSTAATAAPSQPAPPPPPPPPKPSPPFVIEHNSRLKSAWDVLVFIALCVVAAAVPLRIGFSIVEWRKWAAPDVISDVVFLVDVLFRCVTTFEQEGDTVRDRTIIWWNYFSGWFWIDVLAVFPGEIVAAGTLFYTPLYRCNRLLKALRFGTYFHTWERDSSMKPTIIRLVKSAFTFLYYCHFIGCAFFLIVQIEGDTAHADFTGQDGILEEDITSQYFRSLYWGMVVMPGFNNSNPSTLLEVCFLTFVTLSGVMFVATIIGAVGDMATNLDSSKIYFRSKMDEVEDYMLYKKLPNELMQDVRSYYNYLWQSGKALEKNDLLQDLPQYLKNKMSLFLNREIVAKVPLFKECADDEKFITAVVMCLKGVVFLPNFFVVRKGEFGTDMYFISRGELNVVTDEGVVVFTLKDGGFFGEIALLYDTKRTATIVARTYCDMFVLTKDDFKKVMKAFPDQSKGIKQIAQERFQKIIDDEKKKEAAAAQARAKEAAEKAKKVEPVVEDAVVPMTSDDAHDEPHVVAKEAIAPASARESSLSHHPATPSVPHMPLGNDDGGDDSRRQSLFGRQPNTPLTGRRQESLVRFVNDSSDLAVSESSSALPAYNITGVAEEQSLDPTTHRERARGEESRTSDSPHRENTLPAVPDQGGEQ